MLARTGGITAPDGNLGGEPCYIGGMWRAWPGIVVISAGACGAPRDTPDARPVTDASPSRASVTITATVTTTRITTREHMLASAEMQLSGEPLAEAMGRDLAGYSRDRLPSDLYSDPGLSASWIDLAGFSTAVESYEYSKQPMNGLAFEWGAGTSLVHAPLVNPTGATGAAATALLAARVQHLAAGSNAAGKWVFAPGTYPICNLRGNVNPHGAGDPSLNPLGWPGLWPTAHAYRSFDPAIDPTSAEDLRCTIVSDDDPAEGGGDLISADYECDASSLHLRDRATQLDRTITPGADGFSAWKYGLWVINYLQVMHDATGAGVASVPEGSLAQVGVPGNAVVGDDGDGDPTAAGTYLGSSDIEGFQAAMFITSLDARADDWLLRLATHDGASLSGFADLAGALAYDHDAPLRWFPAAIAVTETEDASGFPRPAYAIGSPDSELLDLAGVLLGYSTLYALTDHGNADVGGAQPARAYFDGDPFADDDQRADGEPTVHDRALAMLRVALVDLDRLHLDPGAHLLVDHVAMSGGAPARGHTVSTPSVAYALLGLRAARRALASTLELYSNNTPDTAVTTTPLDAAPLHVPGDAGATVTSRITALIAAHGRLLLDHLTTPAGRAYDGWDVAAGAPTGDGDHLDAHAAAIRGLFAAFLATGDVRYRDRAIAVFARLEATFYDADARIYGATAAPVTSVEYTPLRFALIQSALRDVYELVATRPGAAALAAQLEERLGRLDTLILNGWDDRDRDRVVGAGECVDAPGGLARGGLQMAERTLTGETGRFKDEIPPGTAGRGDDCGPSDSGPPTRDRDDDCVPEVDDAHLPAALAGSVTFQVVRP